MITLFYASQARFTLFGLFHFESHSLICMYIEIRAKTKTGNFILSLPRFMYNNLTEMWYSRITEKAM